MAQLGGPHRALHTEPRCTRFNDFYFPALGHWAGPEKKMKRDRPPPELWIPIIRFYTRWILASGLQSPGFALQAFHSRPVVPESNLQIPDCELQILELSTPHFESQTHGFSFATRGLKFQTFSSRLASQDPSPVATNNQGAANNWGPGRVWQRLADSVWHWRGCPKTGYAITVLLTQANLPEFLLGKAVFREKLGATWRAAPRTPHPAPLHSI